MSIVPRSSSDLWDSSFPRDLWESSFPRDLWEPFERFPFIRDFFEAPFWGFGPPSLSSSFVETPEAHVMKAYMPGVKKEDVKVEVEDGVVTVTIPKKEVKRPERRTIEIAGL